jgi:Tfp pilus assembly protein PilF
MKAGRATAMMLLAALLAWVGWQVVLTTRVDALAKTDPDAALRLDPDDAAALLAVARHQLAQGDDEGATASARRVLRTAPGQGDAFAIIALAAAQRHAPEANDLLEIAAQRSPRVPQVRAQLAVGRLQAGDLQGAMTQIDALLRFNPDQGKQFLPAMAQQSMDPRFADVMVATLVRNPPWRGSFLEVINRKAPPAAVDNIYARLMAAGGLSVDEARLWLDYLIARGRWGDAFSSWTGWLKPTPTQIPLVRNSGFEDEIDGVGFGWRNAATPGAFTDIEPGAGSDGSRAAHTHFIGRPAPGGNLRQPLFLGPGRYRMSVRVRADALQSDQGLVWGVRCDRGAQIAASGPIQGSFGWKTVAVDFEVPPGDCQGQWLELRNPAVRGSAQQVQGDLWTDNIAITPVVDTAP